MTEKKVRGIKAVAIAAVCCAVLGLATLITGAAVQSKLSAGYDRKLSGFTNEYYRIETTYSIFGVSGQETANAISDFLKNMPGYEESKNNVLIVDDTGKIEYQANSNYIHPVNGKLNLVFDNEAMLSLDATGNEKHWYAMRWLGGARASYFDFEGGAPNGPDRRYISTGNLADDLSDLSNMLHYGEDKPEANVSVEDLTYSQTNQKAVAHHYLVWLRDASVDTGIEKYFGPLIFIEGYTTTVGFCLFLLYWLVLAPLWVFLDARRKNTQPLPWALLVLLTNIVGLAVYWIYQSQNSKAPALACPACDKPVKKAYPYCPWCTAPLVTACKGCGKVMEKGWVSCPWCGKPAE